MDAEHVQNLNQVLKKTSDSGLCLCRDKCKFMVPSVTYLHHTIDAEVVHPTDEKVQAMKNAAAPQDMTELKSYLGLV